MEDGARRDQAYAELFGDAWESFPDDTGESQIEVRRIRAALMKERRECDIWVTSGMSDMAMLSDDGDAFRRELIFYAEPGDDYAMALRAVARFPLEHETSLDHGHSIQLYGSFFVKGGAEALANDALAVITLPHLVLLAPLVRRHQRLNEELVIDGCDDDIQLQGADIVSLLHLRHEAHPLSAAAPDDDSFPNRRQTINRIS